ncbi:MAG: efflux RND transporter periplasmic adaptor subunit [Candidatus Eisenbacteria bacterium]|uniref:Efflux RND transporter periplasmic adaptor subunit n=1 Tax=Eiseniibacteriota bacterium TaxID=2212470 RepID=A0A849T098_UNCEI|nr:efflux RND transporter periplasmic adaptor subunit [Candidatus Eisenbacteria bacterium]
MSSQDLSSLRIDRSAPSRSGGRGKGFVLAGAVAAVVAAAIAAFGNRTPVVEVTLVESSGGSAAVGGNITANGYVVARTKASVSAKIPGRLAYLGVTEGSRVKKGQIIARIENADYVASREAARASIGQTQAQLDQAERDLTRARALRERQLISDVELEDASTRAAVLRAQIAADRARVGVTDAALENTNVRAPFDGTILRKDAEVGEIVAPSSAGGGLTRTAIVTMADLGTLEVEVDVNEAYIAQVKNAQPSAITLDAYPDTSFKGQVRQVVPTADRQKATVLVKVSITDRDPRILPEMGAKVEFLRASADSTVAAAPRRVTVAVAAVRRADDGDYVWIVEDGKLQKQSVETGTDRGENVDVRSGLTGGEMVVLAPTDKLREGMKVQVKNP